MKTKHKLNHRRRDDRRKNPDRRNGNDRRTNRIEDTADNHTVFYTLEACQYLFNTLEACQYLNVSRPTYLKYITSGKIKAQKIGRGWRVLKEELDRFVRGD